jgi:hypothetical protein
VVALAIDECNRPGIDASLGLLITADIFDLPVATIARGWMI